MKNLYLATALFCTSHVFAEVSVIYGKDNRKDIYQTTNALHKKLASSTAGMIPLGMFAKGASNELFNLEGSPTLERSENVCTSEAFSQQKVAPVCSGFLVGPDTLVTAGHCYSSIDSPENVCKRFAWVFDYQMNSSTTDPTKNISLANIYLCKQVVAHQYNSFYDFTVIKLDRKVVGREPLKFRTSGKISSDASLVVIGHPSALPTKISDGGKIISNNSFSSFITNLDTFHGNSGSAVFDATTGQIEGILTMGKNDYVPSIPSNPQSCVVVNKCDDNGKNCTEIELNPLPGETVIRIQGVVSDIQKSLAIK